MGVRDIYQNVLQRSIDEVPLYTSAWFFILPFTINNMPWKIAM
jgi:hypothetical protein